MSIATPARVAGLASLGRLPVADFGHYPTPVDQLVRFRAALGLAPRISAKRDDAISFGFGGNKIRKLRYVIPEILAQGGDTVITCGGIQSNHARATAAAAAASGLACHLVANGARPIPPTANARLNELLGATIEYVAGRADRIPAMERAAERLRAAGRRPALVPLGASTPTGALGYVAAIGELLSQRAAPDVIVVASSSGGTLAGLVTGIALHGLATRVIAISADDPPAAVETAVRGILRGLGPLLGTDGDDLAATVALEVDDGFVGDGYGIPTAASREAQETAARTEALFVDHTYTAKALAGLVAYARDGRIPADADVLFWHTGGQVGLFT
jgi:1-aminocyclopropane-1-carboxylate deaminase/D-cysteine desulfhydrase-like pyridoxal-dependent ACC family enzyme